MMNVLIISGLIMLLTSLFFFVVQILNWSFMNEEQMKKYYATSKIQKENRTDEEQKYIEHTWDSYYIQKIRNFSFKIGIILFPLALFISYITSTWSAI
jgi:hypothetical protein